MEKLLIRGGARLHGSLEISGAKNAVLPILAASLLTDKKLLLTNLPHLYDVTTTLDLLGGIGSHITVTADMGVVLHNNAIANLRAPAELVRTMRASILVLGPLLGRFGRGEVAMPGGCAIGARPVNLHLEGLKALGATIDMQQDLIIATAQNGLRGGRFTFDQVSVTGTENLIMAAVLAKGPSVLENCACEPEVIDLVKCLRMMGAKISGEGSHIIEIEGVDALDGGNYRVMPDRIEAATYLTAVAITGGEATLYNTQVSSMTNVIDKLAEAGCSFEYTPDTISIRADYDRPKPVNIVTEPYPGFPTDMQAQLVALNCFATGEAVVKENVFENRFMHVYELNRMGADIRLEDHTAYITGKQQLQGAEVSATDLRASASLVLAGLGAQGETTISSIHHIDRGYEGIEEKLMRLGADIVRIPA